jgi:hypothetical protein
METKEGFKVVTPGHRRGGLWSCTVWPYSCSVEYIKDVWTSHHEDNGPLAVFSSADDALSFSDSLEICCEIWKCEYEESAKQQLWMEWGNEYVTIPYVIPPGTVLADRVKLIERVER